MKQDRRGFLGLLGLGAAAGPIAAQELISGQGFNSLGVEKAVGGNYDFEDDDDEEDDDEFETEVFKNSDKKKNRAINRIEQAVKEFNQLKNKDPMDSLPRFIRQVHRLDGDLLVSRSLSLNARIRMQAIRNLIADREEKLSAKSYRINNVVKMCKGTLSLEECFSLITKGIIGNKSPTFETFVKAIKG